MDIVERKRPSGAFLNLFDWPGKSRKKLFSSNVSQISDDSKQAKEKVQNPSTTQHSVSEVNQTVKNSAFNPRSDSSCCASSVTSDDGNVARAPSVVARLMGLECLPQPNVMERPDHDPYFLRSSRQANTFDHQSDVASDHLDSRTSKGPRKRMIERFQTETLPPRSAKPISVTHSKLLSPIRNPGFVPSRNPACVMEAASRMIEPSPRMMARARVVKSSDSSSPVPLRVRDLKEKLEAAQKASTSYFSDNKKTKASGRNSCDGLKGEVKPSSGSQKHDNLTASSSGNNRSQKKKAEAKSRAVKSQNGLKGSSLSAGKNVLKQNHQKQNCKDNQKSRKTMNKVVNKVVVDSGSTSKKSLPRSKKQRNEVQENGIKRGEKSIKCNVSIDGDSRTSRDDQKRETDVVSFTFSSSMKGLSSHSQGNIQDADSAVRFNVIGGDSLNALLEQKLRELTSKIEASSSSLIQEESLVESGSVSDCTSFYNNQKCQKKIMQGEEHEVSSISTLTEANDSTLSCNKSFSDCRQESDYGIKVSSSDQEVTWVSSTVDWEFEYITNILNSSQLMFQDLASGTTTNKLLLPSSLFDGMERSRGAVTSMKMERKALFDCVNQSLAVKFERMLVGSCKGMMVMLEHRDLLAEEVNREVKGLKKMRDMMIDELVDHDMSCLEGRWIGYEREMFEEGIDIEGEIVSSLVDDLVSDILSIGFLKKRFLVGFK